MVIGGVIIKHKLCLSDVEIVLQIQENPYMQYFVGLAGFQMEEPFASSLFVEIRKHMDQSVFEGLHLAFIGAHNGEKEKKESRPETPEKLQTRQQEEAENNASSDSLAIMI